MTILAIDGGLATFGWAIVVPGAGLVIACGVLIQKPDPKLGVLADRKRRASNQADLLARLLVEHEVGTVAVEEMSFAPRSSANAKIGIGLSWGLVLGAAHARGAAHVVIPPKTWQRAIVPAAIGESERAAIDYKRVFDELSTFVDMRATGLDRIAKSQRNHALDAVGIGVYAALRLTSLSPWIARKIAKTCARAGCTSQPLEDHCLCARHRTDHNNRQRESAQNRRNPQESPTT